MKEIKFGNRVFVQNSEGKWRMLWPELGLNEPMKESELIDIIKKNKKLMRHHFPMEEFHS